MNLLIKTMSISVFCIAMIACVTKQKTTTAVVTPQPPSNQPISIGLNAAIPTEENVTAIKIKYPNVTLQTLTKGQTIFVGACTNCHEQYPIQKFNESDWSSIIDEMAPKAYLTDVDKDALVKYVMSIKATTK